MDNRYLETPREKFRLVRCSRCGLVYLNPRPTAESLALFYPPCYSPYQQKVGVETPRLRGLRGLGRKIWLWIGERRHEERRSLINRLYPLPGRLLGVGCATGRFLAQMQPHGWQVAGVEWNAQAAARAREALGAEVHTGDVLSCPWPDASFDVVTLWHVLEHLPDPKAALEKIIQLLRPGGRVVILAPSAANAEFWLLGRLDHHPVDIPRHLYHFSPSTLTALLKQTGFQIERTKTFSWNVTPRLTSVLQEQCQRRQSQALVGRAIRSVGMLSAWGIGMATAALLGLFAKGPGFIIVGRKAAH
ncbi:MAG TPA: class I SAM-dependent methyltransferase [Verrucomicrobiae bacterium]|nr:class I SAM-dependent methyltransferase [Verrucomicrobiae bacterium]